MVPHDAKALANLLELGDVVVGDEHRIPVPADRTGYGLVAGVGRTERSILESLRAGLAVGTLLQVPEDVGRGVGLQVAAFREAPHVVRVVDTSSTALKVRALEGSAGWGASPDDPGTVYVDLDRTGTVAVLRGDGSGLILRPDADGFVVTDFAPRLPVAPLAELRAPLDDFAARCRDDEWLQSQLETRGNLLEGWQLMVAAGMCARLYEPPTPRERSQLVTRWLQGGAGEVGVQARRWARSLRQEELNTVEDLALAVVDRLSGALDHLEASMAPSEDWWQAALRDLCLERDDLESVALLLAESRRADRVRAALSGLDEAASRFAASIPVVIEVDEERLRRARLGDPFAWWAMLGHA